MKKLLLIFTISLLTGCTYNMNGFDKYKHQPLEELAKCLGFPNKEELIMGKKVYTWSYKYNSWYCDIRTVVDENNRMIQLEWDGNNGGCLYFSEKVKNCNISSQK